MNAMLTEKQKHTMEFYAETFAELSAKLREHLHSSEDEDFAVIEEEILWTVSRIKDGWKWLSK
jgi:hypothetical protein